jgi:molybdopterin molybdotransferase
LSCDDIDEGALTSYPKALATVLAKVSKKGTTTVSIADALGHYLAEPAVAQHDAPRFEQSSMDGFAVRVADVSGPLFISGELPAGNARQMRLAVGETIKVFTGSRLPAGTEAVVMKEFVAVDDDTATITRAVSAGDHIRRVGEEFKQGTEIIPMGTHITPPVVGMLAFLGLGEILVGMRPSATVITMGDELVAPGEEAGDGQIHDANGPAMVAAMHALGITEVRHQRVSDDPAKLETAMAQGIAESDVLITVGGASVGDHDHVHSARAKLGINDLFAKVAIKPGKPNLFGLAQNGVPVWGLPGNPVSALVSYHQLVKPALIAMMGGHHESQKLSVIANQEIRPNKGRLNWLRGTLKFVATDPPRTTADLVAGQGSHMLSGLALADVLLEIPADTDGFGPDTTFSAVPLKWRD